LILSKGLLPSATKVPVGAFNVFVKKKGTFMHFYLTSEPVICTEPTSDDQREERSGAREVEEKGVCAERSGAFTKSINGQEFFINRKIYI